jgi:hypothetical protein
MTDEKKPPSRDDAISEIIQVGISIEVIEQYNLEYAQNAAMRLAKLSHKVLFNRSNSTAFKYNFGELRRLRNQLSEFRKTIHLR